MVLGDNMELILPLSKDRCASSPLFRFQRRMSAECVVSCSWFAFRWVSSESIVADQVWRLWEPNSFLQGKATISDPLRGFGHELEAWRRKQREDRSADGSEKAIQDESETEERGRHDQAWPRGVDAARHGPANDDELPHCELDGDFQPGKVEEAAGEKFVNHETSSSPGCQETVTWAAESDGGGSHRPGAHDFAERWNLKLETVKDFDDVLADWADSREVLRRGSVPRG